MVYNMLRRSRGYSNVSAVYPEDPILTPSPPEHCGKVKKKRRIQERTMLVKNRRKYRLIYILLILR